MLKTKNTLSESKVDAIFLLKSYNSLLRQYPKEYALILFGIGSQIVFYILYPQVFQSVFDSAIPHKDFSLLLRLIVEVCILLLICSIGAVVQIRYMAKVGGRVLSDIRRDMATKLNTLGFDFYSRVESVELLSRFSSDMERIENSLTRALPSLVENILVTLGCFLTIAVIDWRMGLAALILLPVGFLGNALFERKEDTLNSQSRNLKNHMLASADDFSKSWHLIHAYNDKKQIRNRFEKSNADYTLTSTRHSYYINLAPAFSDYGNNLSLTFILLLGAVLVMQGGMTIGAFVGCFALLRKVADGSGKSAKTFSAYISALRPYKRVQKLLNEDESIAEASDAIDIPVLRKEIRFEGVSYGYSRGRTVLQDLNLLIAAGSSMAIVGASGSGKSTLIKLITRIIDPVQGSISFDGVDIRRASVASLRRSTGHVLQENHIIRGSIAENLRFAKHDASQAQIEDAAQKAEIHDFIMSLAQGYETLLDDRGSLLSGGQRQRIAIARALIVDPAVLFLDEPTSMLDPITESVINGTIAQLTVGRTVILATHRLASARSMDKIVVLDAGKMVEMGNHEELMALNGMYRSLWDKQHGFTMSAEGFARISPERLQRIPLFSKLRLEVLGELAEQFNTESFESGATIIREGAKGEKFYITVRGSLEVLKKDAQGTDRQLRILQDGDHFGEIALLQWVPRTATVRTLSNTQCLSLSRERFARLVETQPELRKVLADSWTTQ
ncbi:MAG: ATP-binding cassette domain-containing protein [Rhodoferax sp.]|jgi:ATP-binding cassette subfamily B protein|uniref:ATP-binding cassette domain-containing protein n=1 Tax=Rhodoferax sp. TaxID=50421 RepID=UPI003BAFB361